MPDWLKGAKTRTEAKSKMRAEARKHHPDLGGNAEKMKGVNTDWEDFQKSEHWGKMKESSAMYFGFFNELEKIYRNE